MNGMIMTRDGKERTHLEEEEEPDRVADTVASVGNASGAMKYSVGSSNGVCCAHSASE